MGIVFCPSGFDNARVRHVFIRLSNEGDFNKALSKESCEIDGVNYQSFAWTPDFNEEHEPSYVPVWIYLLGLPLNFFPESILKILKATIGRFICRDNPTLCVTITNGARVCIEADASRDPIPYFWIGRPGLPRSRR